MSVLAAITFAAFLLEDNHLVAFHEGTFYLANNFRPFYGGCAYLNGTVGVNEQNAVKLYGLTLFLVIAEIVNIQELAGLSLELLSLNFYNCVHLTY